MSPGRSQPKWWPRALVAALSVGGLFALTWWTSPPLREVASLEASAPRILPEDAPEGGRDQGASQVRYSEPITITQPTRVTVRVEGTGSAHVSLIDEQAGGPPRIREAMVEAPGIVRFASVEPGEWSMRLNALVGSRDLRAVALLGGPSWALFSVFAAILLLPLLWPYRKRPVETWRRLTADPSS